MSEPARMSCLRLLLVLLVAGWSSPSMAQDMREVLSFPQQHRGKTITVAGDLLLPAGVEKVPALLIHHGSGGVSADREWRYARELVKLGVATFVIDSFKPRGVTSTVQDQSAVTTNEMLADAFAALKALAAHPRIDDKHIGITGFSKGGSVALLAAHEARAAAALPEGLRFALHVPFYPWCGTQHYKPKMTGAPIYILIGEADAYVGVEPCRRYAGSLRRDGAPVDFVVYPGAPHGFDGGRAYQVARGENYSRCVFVEQPDRTWKETFSGITTNDSRGRRIEGAYRKALAKCRTYGVSGGPNAAARTQSMQALKTYVQRHLMEGQ
jgi:dienelactone hydrolase